MVKLNSPSQRNLERKFERKKFSEVIKTKKYDSETLRQFHYSVSVYTQKVIKFKNYLFQTSVARAGSTVNFQVIGPLYAALLESFDKQEALGWTLAIAGSTCIISLCCAIVSS